MTQTIDGLNTAALQDIAANLIKQALIAGADAAEASVGESRSTEISIRDGLLEDIEGSESLDAGVRVFIGKKQAGVGFSDLSASGIKMALDRAVAMAKLAPEDPLSALCSAERLEKNPPKIQQYDDTVWTADDLEARAIKVEKAARAVEGVTMTESAFASYGLGGAAYATSTGFNHGWRKSVFSFGISVIAERDGAKERDYSGTGARRPSELRSEAEIGEEAGTRVVKRLGPRKLESGTMPVVFDRRVATTFLGAMCGAISGPAVARGVSFLREKLGEQVFAKGINIVEDPHRDWGHGSCPFDGEGTPNKASSIIEDGRLTTWLLNSASARQLDMTPTGHARRNMGGAPGAGVTNLHLEAGTTSLDDMIGAIEDGVYITEMFGPSLNSNTGDWSVGVSGYHIVKGVIVEPVAEITVAGNLVDMFGRLTPASDLEFRGSVNSPSVYFDAMSVGGL